MRRIRSRQSHSNNGGSSIRSTPPLRAFIGPGCGYRQMRREGGFRDDPVPLMCWECGKALAGRKIRFCSQECATTFSAAYGVSIPGKAGGFRM